ncbi:MAG: DUF255 domain-containing protein [Bacteroidetes bacterium]|nr:MAG: DUF255 domain-containing protein [Bacteroidota bacterium]TAG89946.1 MAG: DUF255 domain-containing protein [Bacteroidota bacterium]
MKAINVLILASLPFLFGFSSKLVFEENNKVVWVTDYAKALKDAKKSKKTLLLNFTGSDWCSWCIRLDKEVFDKAAFVEYAKKNLICVKLDFPQRTKVSPEEKIQNNKLMKKHSVKGFPTILLVDAKENVVLRTGYQAGGEDAYIEHLKEAMTK